MLRSAACVVIALVIAILLEQDPLARCDELVVSRILLPPFPSQEIEQVANRIHTSLEKQSHYLLQQLKPWKGDDNYKLLTESRSEEHWIRPNTGALQGFCLLYRFGDYNEDRVGISRERLLHEVIRPMFRYLVETHVTGSRVTDDGKPWGDAWQSAHWAQMLGRGAWWIWDDLSPDLRQGVLRVVRHEAGRFVRQEPPAQLRGDTKAEENAWNAQIFSMAMALMPNDEEYPAWERAFQRWTLSAFLRPADKNSPAIVDGRPVSAQFVGANIYDDFTLENHGFVHPDYMSTFSLSLGTAGDFRMRGKHEPESVYWNTAGIYENLKWFLLPDMGFVYPNGQDWTVFRQPSRLIVHALQFVYGHDSEAWDLLCRTLNVIEKMQSRSQDGAIYAPGQYFFPSTQTDIAAALASAWVHLHFADPAACGVYRPRLGVRYLESARLVIHRTPSVVHTLSSGPVVMATVNLNRPDRLTSPDQRSLLGQIRLSNSREPLAIKLVDCKVQTTQDGFHAILVVNHGKEIQSQWVVDSHRDGKLALQEKLVALQDCATRVVATGLIAIMNNQNWIFERGERTVRWDDEVAKISAHSGQEVFRSAQQSLTVDDSLQITFDQPVQTLFRGAAGPERGRATDRLYLHVINGERHWQAGDILATWNAVIIPLEATSRQ